jgi:YesN/AraC family two-component response regulator
VARTANSGRSKNGEEAIQLVEKHQPDLIFLDIRMPIKTGLEAAKEIGNKAHRIHYRLRSVRDSGFDHGALTTC